MKMHLYIFLVLLMCKIQESYSFGNQPVTRLARKIPYSVYLDSGKNEVCKGIVISPLHILVHARCNIGTTVFISPVTISSENDYMRNEIGWWQTRNNIKILEVELWLPVLNRNVSLYVPIDPAPLLTGQTVTLYKKNRTEVRKMPPVLTLCKRKTIGPNFNNRVCVFEETFLCPGNRFGYILLAELGNKQTLTFVRRSVYNCRPKYPSGYVKIADFLRWMVETIGYQPEIISFEEMR